MKEKTKYEDCLHEWKLDKTKSFGQYAHDKDGKIISEKESSVMVCKKCNSMKVI